MSEYTEFKAMFDHFSKALSIDEDMEDKKAKKKDEVVETLKKVGVAGGVVAAVALLGLVETLKKVGVVGGVVVGVALLEWGISKFVNGGEWKKMKKNEVVETLKKVGVAWGVFVVVALLGWVEILKKAGFSGGVVIGVVLLGWGIYKVVDGGGRKKTKEDEVVETLKKVGVAGGVIAGAALLGWGISKAVNDGGRRMMEEDDGDKKMMKAPGRENCYIRRDVFERDPTTYFRNLRK